MSKCQIKVGDFFSNYVAFSENLNFILPYLSSFILIYEWFIDFSKILSFKYFFLIIKEYEIVKMKS